MMHCSVTVLCMLVVCCLAAPQNPMVAKGKAKLAKAKMHLAKGKFNAIQELPGLEWMSEKNCPKWKPYEEMDTCWIAETSFDKLPSACQGIPLPPTFPKVIADYFNGKYKEMVTTMSKELTDRGAPKTCGMCGRKARCRVRETIPEMDQFFCEPKQKEMFMDESCMVTEPCKLTQVKGGCPPPIEFIKNIEPALLVMMAGQMEDELMEDFMKDGSSEEMNLLGEAYGPPVDPFAALPEPRSFVDDLVDVLIEGSGEASSIDTKKIVMKEVFKTIKDFAEDDVGMKLRNMNVSSMLPMWHCIPNKAGDGCLCCCDNYFPDPESKKCTNMKGPLKKWLKSSFVKVLGGALVDQLLNGKESPQEIVDTITGMKELPEIIEELE